VALYPPPPVARWPELTLVAARAVAAAIGGAAAIDEPNDVVVDGRKVAGILAEASDRVVLGIGVNVGAAPWPGAGSVDADRLERVGDGDRYLVGAVRHAGAVDRAVPRERLRARAERPRKDRAERDAALLHEELDGHRLQQVEGEGGRVVDAVAVRRDERR